MKFEIARVTRVIDLREYAEGYEGVEIRVWVNPPQRLLGEHDRILEEVGEAVKKGLGEEAGRAAIERAGEDLARVFSELWSAGPEETRWTVEEVEDLVRQTMDQDPQLWFWLRKKSIGLIREYRNGIKKISGGVFGPGGEERDEERNADEDLAGQAD